MASSPSISKSSSSSSGYLANPPRAQTFTAAQKKVIPKLECLRYTSSAFAIAVVVALVAIAVLIGVAQGSYVPPESPLYALAGAVPLIGVTIALDCGLRALARKNKINPEDYFRIYQRPDPKPKPKKKDD